jgi:hypothetical protein
MTCEELSTRFSYFLDAFSCGMGESLVCPNLMGAGTMGCQTVCTAPIRQGELCCYGLGAALPACGRPFSVGEELRRAPVVSREDWQQAGTYHDFAKLNPKLEDALARAWEEDAALEYASIASFARLTLELLALGAPAELVRESQAASLDEISHAELCFALASRYRNAPVGPGSLRIEGALAPADLALLAAETVREGCVGETLAALLAAAQLAQASDPKARAALVRIADDEARHAELSWKIVRWAIATGGEPVSEAASQAFERALTAGRDASTLEDPIIDELRSNGWHAHGRLLPHEHHAVICSGLADVIEPCARALLA